MRLPFRAKNPTHNPVDGRCVCSSAYPVDSHHVDELKGYSKTAIGMQKELEKSGVHINRNAPDLLWVSKALAWHLG